MRKQIKMVGGVGKWHQREKDRKKERMGKKYGR